jgi:subtilisin family serine protease
MGTSEGGVAANFSAAYAWNLQKLQTQCDLNGAGTVIAILDTGVINHDLLRLPNVTYIDIYFPDIPSRADYPNTTHAKLCAYTILGFDGVCGVAPHASVIIYRVLEDVSVISALDDIGMKISSGQQIDVVSISSSFTSYRLEEIHGKIKALCGHGVVFVAAVGNSGNYHTHLDPARFDDCVLSVGSLDEHGNVSSFNSTAHVDIFAPGEGIRSPWSGDVQYSGSSFATSAAAGLVLLLKQCANLIGGATRENIHRIEILREIFEKHMMSRVQKLLDPEGFFDRLLNKDHDFLRRIVEHISGEQL